MTVWLILAVVVAETALSAGWVALAAVLAVTALTTPLLLVPGSALAGTYLLLRRLRHRAAERERQREDVALLADLTALALTGGLGIRQALEIASGAVGGSIADEVDLMLRRSRVDGMVAAMTDSAGAGRELYRVIGSAIATGSALVDQVTRVADDLHATAGARRLEKVRRVPVTMLFPLTLLVLPGFLLLTIAPALVDAFMNLEL